MLRILEKGAMLCLALLSQLFSCHRGFPWLLAFIWYIQWDVLLVGNNFPFLIQLQSSLKAKKTEPTFKKQLVRSDSLITFDSNHLILNA